MNQLQTVFELAVSEAVTCCPIDLLYPRLAYQGDVDVNCTQRKASITPQLWTQWKMRSTYAILCLSCGRQSLRCRAGCCSVHPSSAWTVPSAANSDNSLIQSGKWRCHVEAPSADEVRQALDAASGSKKEAVREARNFRRSLNKTGRYIRQIVNDETCLEQMDSDGVGYSRTGLVARVRA